MKKSLKTFVGISLCIWYIVFAVCICCAVDVAIKLNDRRVLIETIINETIGR